MGLVKLYVMGYEFIGVMLLISSLDRHLLHFQTFYLIHVKQIATLDLLFSFVKKKKGERLQCVNM